MLIGIIVGKKINILFKFSNVNKLAVNRFRLWMVGHAADGARLRSSQGQEHSAAGRRNFTYSNPLRGQSPR